nr:hypothetical protein [uncultured Bacteroides sp.]
MQTRLKSEVQHKNTARARRPPKKHRFVQTKASFFFLQINALVLLTRIPIFVNRFSGNTDTPFLAARRGWFTFAFAKGERKG